MTIFAFAGPSLPRAQRHLFPGIVWLPPCEAGDLLRLAPAPRDRVCIIDGWFDHRPAIRHKEILLALSDGAILFGASSIGALRAAEMAPCGMIGVGGIFRAFASGRLTGDDEVALVHAPEDWDWRPLSLPLVDVRATLCKAVRRQVIAPIEARALMTRARGLHYVDRNWHTIGEDLRLPDDRTGEVLNWLALENVSQKNLDAQACLAAATAEVVPDIPPPVAVRTIFLEALRDQCAPSPAPAPDR